MNIKKQKRLSIASVFCQTDMEIPFPPVLSRFLDLD